MKEATLRELLGAGAVSDVIVKAEGRGLCVVVRCGTAERTLANKKGDTRLFASLDTLVFYLSKFGRTTFQVDARGYEPGRLRKARPDRAKALRETRTQRKQGILI